MQTTEEFTTSLKEALRKHPTLHHPIILKLSNTQSPHPQLLRLLALQGYQLTKEFSRYIAALMVYCPIEFRPRLATNLYEEETGELSHSSNHYKLMHKFLDGLGITPEERETALPLPTTKELIDYRWKLALSPSLFHQAAASIFIGSEGQNLEKREGKSRYDLLLAIAPTYGFKDEHLEFFKIHTKEDEYHFKDGLDILSAVCTTASKQNEAIETVTITCQKFQKFFDGIEKAYLQAPQN